MIKYWKWLLYPALYALLGLWLTSGSGFSEARTALGVLVFVNSCLLIWFVGLEAQRRGSKKWPRGQSRNTNHWGSPSAS